MEVENLLDHDSLLKLTKEELIIYHLKVANLSTVIVNLDHTVKDLTIKLEKAESDASLAMNTSKLLKDKVDLLERRLIHNERINIGNGQYLRNKQVEVKLVSAALPFADLKSNMADLLSLTGTKVIPSDFDKCHMNSDSSVIMEFKTREQRDEMLLNRKNLKNKKTELKEMKLDKSYIIESMTKEYSFMDYVCRRMKFMKKIAETWFWNGRLWVRVDSACEKKQISHIEDLYDLFGIEEVDRLAIEKPKKPLDG